MEKTKKSCVNKGILGIMIFFFTTVFLLGGVSAAIINASMIDHSDGISSAHILYEKSPQSFRDGTAINPRIRARVCADDVNEILGEGVTFAYVLGYNTPATRKAVRVSETAETNFLTLSESINSFCAETSNDLRFPTGLAVYPGHIGLVLDENNNDEIDLNVDTFIRLTSPDAFSAFHFVGHSNNQQGSAFSTTSQSSIEGSYIPNTGLINANIINAFGHATDGDNVAVDQTDKDLVAGVCVDELGLYCTDVKITSVDASSEDYDTGVSNPEDTDEVTIRHFLVNGLLQETFCIGPKMEVTNVPDVFALSGDPATLEVTIRNNGNVDVETHFSLILKNETGHIVGEKPIGDDFEPNQQREYEFNVTPPTTSGTYTYTAIINHSEEDIDTCGDQVASMDGDVVVGSAVLPKIWINEEPNGNFSYAGQIYNVTIQLNDTDNSDPEDFANWSLEVREVNSYNIFAPLQYNNETNSGFVGTISTAYLILDGEGYGQFTLSPMGSKAFKNINGTSKGLYSEKLSEYPKDFLSEYSLEFRVLDDEGTVQDVLYQETPYLGGDWAPFTFTNSDDFDLDTVGVNAPSDKSSPNAEVIEDVWNKIRQVALSLMNRLQI